MTLTSPSNGFDTEVLIVGAGPTGLALATTLLRSGITPIVIEKLASGQNTSRAAVIHAHTLETLESLGVSQALINEGLQLDRFNIRDRDQVLTHLHFDKLPTRYACLLMLPQDRTEHILADALAQANGIVHWGCTVDSLIETDTGVVATVTSPEGTRTLNARYVVGADGMQSLVRRTAGIGFSGISYEDSFILADVAMQWGLGRDEVNLFFSPAGLLVVAPLPDGRFRLVATLEDAPEQASISVMQRLIDARGPTRNPATIQQVFWNSRFRLHHRVADHYRRGRLLLVGDAAHVHSPAGGQGMNTGLVDASVLGRLLTEVISGRKDDRYLDAYEKLRRPAAEQVLSLAGRLTRMATVRGAPQRLLRNLVLRTTAMLPPARRRLEMNLSGLSRRAATQLP